MHRYFVMVCGHHDPLKTASFASRSSALANSAPADWAVVYRSAEILALQTGPRRTTEVCVLQNHAGLILGNLFHSGSREMVNAPNRLDAVDSRKIVASGGQHLIDSYWGSYVAILWDEASRRHHVFRDPTGAVACYHTHHAGTDIFFSHMEDCVRFLPTSFRVDRHYLVRWLMFNRFSSRATGIEDIEDVPPGECLTLSRAGTVRSRLWDPTRLATVRRFEQPDAAAEALRQTVQGTVDAWAGIYRRITLKLSGGLDSSIIAGCLAHTPSRPQLHYLNVWIDMGLQHERLHLPGIDAQTADKLRAIAGDGDERYFARLVAKRWNIHLTETRRSQAMDLRRLWNTPLTLRPTLYFTAMEVDDAEQELVRTQGTEAFFSGQAGDSVFLATSQPLPALDFAFLHGLRPGIWQHMQDTAKLSRESLWTVLGKTVRHGLLRRPYVSPVSLLQLPTLLRSELAETLTDADFASPLTSLDSHSRLPPGKQNHVAGIAGPAYYDFVFGSGAHADHVDPLASQPVWELMLQIPTYTVLTGGVSRGLARTAFADILPAEIRKRQAKGVGGPFYQQVVRRNLDHLRENLLDGELVAQGYLDRHRLNACLSAQEPSMIIPAPIMLSYLAAEIWLQRWTQHQRSQQNPRQACLAASA